MYALKYLVFNHALFCISHTPTELYMDSRRHRRAINISNTDTFTDCMFTWLDVHVTAASIPLEGAPPLQPVGFSGHSIRLVTLSCSR